MSALFLLFVDLCLMRRGPQHVPGAQVLMQLCALAFVTVSVLHIKYSVINLSPWLALCLALVDLIMLGGFCYFSLYFNRRLARFRQCFTALLGSGTLLGLVVLLLLLWIHYLIDAGLSVVLPQLLMLAVLVWSLAVNSFIFSETLSVKRGVGVCYALGYFILSLMVLRTLLAPEAVQG